MTYKIHTCLTITSLDCIRPLHHNVIKYHGEAISILCNMGTHGLQPEAEFSNFLALQISNAVLQYVRLHSAITGWHGCLIMNPDMES